MNIFRLLGDLSHLASSECAVLLLPASCIVTCSPVAVADGASWAGPVLILIQKIHKSRSCRGISFKTQALYLTVFATRYIDLVTGPYYSFYNTIMKIIFLASSGWIVYLMKGRYRCVWWSSISRLRWWGY